MINLLEKALELINIFDQNGYEAYIVGGFVRDLILKRNSMDVDICTNATPKEVKELFKEVKLPFEQYGSVHLKYKKIDFEITTYRMDFEYNNGRTPSKIEYTDKLIVDLKRRDFTMNTLCMDKDGNIIDLLNGMNDINSRVIKTVGNSKKRLSEDALRILRAIRFSTELDFEISGELKRAIIQNRKLLNKLSFYRKKQELNRIFLSPNILKGLKKIKKYGIEKYLNIRIPRNIVKTNDTIGIWAQINPDSNYEFTTNEKEYIDKIKKLVKSGKITDRDIYKYGNYVCYIAAQILGINEVSIHERYDNLPIKKSSDIVINGKDIIEIVNPSDKKIIKIIMNDVEDKILTKQLDNDYEKIKLYIIDTYKHV